ncbi:helix-turn-helix domain-containing protein [uncultured Clostridium sp.]|uniref:helix-turn-helix domain-containing protein n=1 Tax=uncultured Clostridium sp. TaxID=59620 RepID=UPI0025FEBFDC|nr:helix-turn-helix transcriptional regulator [uncultured Clostridium sp.]
MNYIQKLVKIRKEKNISQSDIAKILNTTQQQVSKYENEKQEMPIRHLITIAKELNISTDYILGLEIKKEKNFTEEEEYILSLYNGLSVPNKREVEDLAKKLGEEQAKRKEKIS